MQINSKNIYMSMNRKTALVPFLLLIAVVILSLVIPSVTKADATANVAANGADIAWMLTATALVLFMTPGLAFFYGGMVNKKNVISTMLQSFISMAVITAFFANHASNSANTTGNGLLFGETHLFMVHLVSMIIVSAFVFGGTFLLLKLTDFITPLRVNEEEELAVLDISQHGEKL